MLTVERLNALVVHDISFTVADGETLALLGKSGSGKTTILRCIAGLQSYSGSITYDGPLSYAEQTITLFPHLTVAENIALPLTIQKIKRDIVPIAQKCQVDHLLTRYPGKLSGGELQRVQLARALVLQPKLFLLDEPFRSLDAYTRDELLAWLKPLLAQLGAATVFVTHDQREADYLATRQLVL